MNFHKILLLVIALLLPSTNPANSAGVSQDIRCSSAGFFSILNGIVVSNTNCVGSARIPDTVYRIQNNAFEGATGLTELISGSNLREIAYRAFANCMNLTSIQLGDSLQKIEAEAFFSSGITSVKLPQSLSSIGAYAFALSKLEGAVTIPEKVNSLYGTFMLTNKIKEVLLPEALTEIGAKTFAGSGLEKISIPKNVKVIGDEAFLGTKIINIKISSSVAEIGMSAFSNSPLSSFEVEDSNQYFSSDTQGVLYDKTKSKIISVPPGLNRVDIPPSVKIIGEYSFRTSSVTSLEIPGTLENINDRAFFNAINLDRISIPGSVKAIGQEAFFQSSLTLLELQNGIERIERDAFASLKLQGVLKIPESVSFIGEGAFYGLDLISSFEVQRQNRFFSSDDQGVLYDKDKAIVLAVPFSRGDVFLPSTIRFIPTSTFVKKRNIGCTYDLNNGSIHSCDRPLISGVDFAKSLLKIELDAFGGNSELIALQKMIQTESRIAAELKARLDAESKSAAAAKAAAELQAKQEAEAKAAAELKAKQEAAAKAAANKKTTITCAKGKLTKKVTAVKPKCPTGYKVKKRW